MKREGMPAEIELIELPLAIPQTPEQQKPGEACGIFAVYAPGHEVAKMAYFGIHELQHRGQNGAGIMVNGELGIIGHKGNGHIDVAISEAVPVFAPTLGREVSILDRASGADIAIGHTRYATTTNRSEVATQPIRNGDNFFFATNGHVELFDGLQERYGLDPDKYTSDSAYIAALYSQEAAKQGIVQAALEVSTVLNGAASSVMSDGETLIALRDPWGLRPLSIGILPDGYYTFASEPVAFNSIGAKFLRDVEPGEVVVVDQKGTRINSLQMDRQEERLNCMFEYIYFARPDSTINGVSVYKARENMGRMLARDFDVEADIVVGVRESGSSAAAGYSKESKLPKEEGLFKNPYVQRSFIEDGSARARILGSKQRANPDVLEGQRVVLVDDSIIKGNTMAGLVTILRDAGATVVHVRSAAPRYLYPCYMGMDTSDAAQLIARSMTNEEICQEIGADSVAFNTVERVKESIVSAARTETAAAHAGKLCTACLTGEYPFKVPEPSHPITSSIPLPMAAGRT